MQTHNPLMLASDVQWEFTGPTQNKNVVRGVEQPARPGAHNEMNGAELKDWQEIHAAKPADSDSTMDRLARAAQRILCIDRPIYCLWRSELPEGFIAADQAIGLTGLHLDLAVRPHVANWAGRGRAIVFNGANLMAEFGDNLVTESVNEVLVHELSHIATSGFPSDAAAAHVEESDRRERALAFVQCGLPTPAPTPEFDEFFFHDAAFFRALSHITVRAHAEGLRFDVFAQHERYQLSDAELYATIIGNEIEEFLGLPLIEALRSTPVPEAFEQLFAADVARIRAAYQ